MDFPGLYEGDTDSLVNEINSLDNFQTSTNNNNNSTATGVSSSSSSSSSSSAAASSSVATGSSLTNLQYSSQNYNNLQTALPPLPSISTSANQNTQFYTSNKINPNYHIQQQPSPGHLGFNNTNPNSNSNSNNNNSTTNATTTTNNGVVMTTGGGGVPGGGFNAKNISQFNIQQPTQAPQWNTNDYYRQQQQSGAGVATTATTTTVTTSTTPNPSLYSTNQYSNYNQQQYMQQQHNKVVPQTPPTQPQQQQYNPYGPTSQYQNKMMQPQAPQQVLTPQFPQQQKPPYMGNYMNAGEIQQNVNMTANRLPVPPQQQTLMPGQYNNMQASPLGINNNNNKTPQMQSNYMQQPQSTPMIPNQTVPPQFNLDNKHSFQQQYYNPQQQQQGKPMPTHLQAPPQQQSAQYQPQQMYSNSLQQQRLTTMHQPSPNKIINPQQYNQAVASTPPYQQQQGQSGAQISPNRINQQQIQPNSNNSAQQQASQYYYPPPPPPPSQQSSVIPSSPAIPPPQPQQQYVNSNNNNNQMYQTPNMYTNQNSMQMLTNSTKAFTDNLMNVDNTPTATISPTATLATPSSPTTQNSKAPTTPKTTKSGKTKGQKGQKGKKNEKLNEASESIAAAPPPPQMPMDAFQASQFNSPQFNPQLPPIVGQQQQQQRNIFSNNPGFYNNNNGNGVSGYDTMSNNNNVYSNNNNNNNNVNNTTNNDLHDYQNKYPQPPPSHLQSHFQTAQLQNSQLKSPITSPHVNPNIIQQQQQQQQPQMIHHHLTQQQQQHFMYHPQANQFQHQQSQIVATQPLVQQQQQKYPPLLNEHNLDANSQPQQQMPIYQQQAQNASYNNNNNTAQLIPPVQTIPHFMPSSAATPSYLPPQAPSINDKTQNMLPQPAYYDVNNSMTTATPLNVNKDDTISKENEYQKTMFTSNSSYLGSDSIKSSNEHPSTTSSSNAMIINNSEQKINEMNSNSMTIENEISESKKKLKKQTTTKSPKKTKKLQNKSDLLNETLESNMNGDSNNNNNNNNTSSSSFLNDSLSETPHQQQKKLRKLKKKEDSVNDSISETIAAIAERAAASEDNDEDEDEESDVSKTLFSKKNSKKRNSKLNLTSIESSSGDNNNNKDDFNDQSVDTGNEQIDVSLNDSDVVGKKKRRYTKKKLISNIIVGQEASSRAIVSEAQGESLNVEASISSIVATVASTDDSSQLQMQTSIISTANDDSNFGSSLNASKKGRKKGSLNKEPSKQRRKNAQHLVKLLKKKQRKKRKLSSDEEEEDDSADDFELTSSAAAAINAAVMKSASAASLSTPAEQIEGAIDTNTSSQAASVMTGSNDPSSVALSDEQAAKLLQANEKRRSVRAAASKRTKYVDDIDFKIADDKEESTADEQIQPSSGNPAFAIITNDTIVVDKILANRTVKRKIKIQRKVEKEPKEKKVAEVKVEAKKEETVEIEVKVDKEDPKPMEIDQTNDLNVNLNQSENKTDEQIVTQKEEETPIVEIVDESKIEEDKSINIAEETKEEVKQEEKNVEEVKVSIENKDETKIVNVDVGDDEEESESEYEEIDGDEEEEVEEFFVKYKALSYLHCEWRTRDELVLQDKRIDQKIKRFKLKKAQANIYNDPAVEVDGYEEDIFNPDYCEVDRILDFYETADLNNELIKYYLVKWKTLAYEESTWEHEKDVNKKKIERYFKFNTIPTDTKIVPRPKADKWNCLTESRVYKNGNNLREYQLEGINWLTFCWLNGRNCILADEMGLGKTIQSITFLQEIAYYGIRGPFLVIVPLSTIGNWSREFETWTDFNIIVYHGSSQSRALIQDYEFYYKEDANGKKSNKNFPKFNALITTYEVLLSDVTMFCQFKWRSLIIDEAHRLKNKNCKLIEGLRCMDVEHKVLLTGTPLQNNVEELFSLLNYLEPTQFHSSQEFMQEFGDLKTDTQVTKLQAILKPMMLRRLKEDVEKNLAPKEETIIEVELTNIQKKYYRAILEKNFQFLARGTAASNMPNLMNTMMELRKCCNHPYLINGAEDQILFEYNERNLPNSSDDQALKIMIQASGKLVLVDKLLPKLKAGGHKVLIFSQMIRVLDILEDYLVQMRFTYERLDGRIRGEMRQEAIDRFCKPDADRFAFLLCTRAGGLGINLTAADTVIIYDSDWNPQNDLQAQARCHRIGQSKSVKIYRLVTRNTYEREMFDRASLKLGLDKAILQSMRNEDKLINQSNQLGKKEIEDLLKKGAYGAIMEEDNAGDKFCEEDIDKILQQRATVIQIEGGEKGSTFSKASFSTSETRSDISIDDPEFWQKWAKKAEIDIESTIPKDDRIIYEPRRRTQTRRYGGPDDVLEEGSDYSSSDSDDEKNGKKGKKSKRGKEGKDSESTNGCSSGNNNGISENAWGRDECYKVEKSLLVYGWNQWPKIISNCKFTNKKRQFNEQDVESLSRTILLFSLQNYHGDDNIKQFILDLIDPAKAKDLSQIDFKNHYGLAAPVPRGRKGKKNDGSECENNNNSNAITLPDVEWARNADELLADENYKKHLIRQANRILLRVRMLFYIRQEIIGDCAQMIEEGYNANDIDFHVPNVQADLPASWWDKEADKSLLIGVYKYGYEKYNQMRADPCLCFLNLCGPPNAKDLLEEQQREEEGGDMEDEDGDYKPANERRLFKNLDQMNEMDEMEVDDQQEPDTIKKIAFKQQSSNEDNLNDKYPFPTVSELNIRLRRVITSFQKLHKKEILMSKRNAEKQEKRLSKLASTQEKAVQRQIEKQTKWSRREESNFYRALSTFGVDFDKSTNLYRWDRFREIGQLDKKMDDTLTDYYNAFYYMCKKVCNKIEESDQLPAVDFMVEPISEERASRCIQRVELLTKLRQEIVQHEHLEERIKLCKTSVDLPDWWIPVKHDKELIVAVARYGVTRTDYYYLNDPDFTFKEYLTKYMKHIEAMMGDNKIDPIQYYFLNQSKIQQSFKEVLEKEIAKELGISDVEINVEVAKKDKSEKEEQEKEEELDDEKNKNNNMSVNSDHSKLQIDESFIDDENIIESKKVVEFILEQIVAETRNEDVTEVLTEEKSVNIKKEVEVVETKPESQVDTNATFEQKQEQPINEMVLSLHQQQQQQQCMEGSDSKPPLGVPMIMWPKDRVICHRLENIIHCVENNEWPERNPFLMSNQTDQQGGLMQSSSMIMSSNYNDKLPASPMLSISDNNDFFDTNSNDKDFKIGFDYDSLLQQQQQQHKGSSKYSKPKRGRPPKMDDPTNKIRQMLTSLPSGSDDNELQLSEIMNAAKSSLFGGGSSPSHIPTSSSSHSSIAAPFLEPGEIVRKNGNKEASGNGNNGGNGNSNKRSRKPTKDPMSMLFLGPNSNPDERVPVINVEDGTRLSGEEAPKRIDLADFLSQNKNFLPEQSDIFELAFGNRRSSKSIKQNHPSTPHDALSFLQNFSQASNLNINNNSGSTSSSSMSGNKLSSSTNKVDQSSSRQATPAVANNGQNANEPNIFNVNYINKVTNKKFVPSKPPTWKNLANFFEKNIDIFIDPASNELVRTKYGRNIPDVIKSRILPSKPTKPNNSSSSSTSTSNSTPTQSNATNNKEKLNNSNSSASNNNNNNNSSGKNANPQNKDKKQAKNTNPTPSSSNSALAAAQQQPQITYPPLSPNSAALAGLSELLMQQGGFNPLTAGLPGFMAAAAQGGQMGLPFGGLGFNPFMMPPFGSSPFGSSPLEDFMKQFGSQKPEDLNLDALNSANGLLSSLQSSSLKEMSSPLDHKAERADRERGSNKQHSNREKEQQRNEKIQESTKMKDSPVNSNLSKEQQKDRISSNSSRDSGSKRESERDRSIKEKERVRDREWEKQEKEKEIRDSSKESKGRDGSATSKDSRDTKTHHQSHHHHHHSHNQNNDNNSSVHGSTSSSKRVVNSESSSSSSSSRKEQNQLAKQQQNKEMNKDKHSSLSNSQQQQQQNHDKFMQEIMNLSQLAASNSFNPNFYLNPLGFPPPQLDSTSSSPTPDAATAAALSQLGPSSLDFGLLLNMMNPLFGASMPPPSSTNPVDLLSALNAAAQTNPGLLDPNQLNKNLLMDLMQQQQQQQLQHSDEPAASSHHKTNSSSSSHKKHSIDSISRSSSNNKQQSTKSSDSHHHHHHSSSSKQQQQQQQPSSSSNSNKAQQANNKMHHQSSSSTASKTSSTESFQGLDLSIKKPKSKNENDSLLKSPSK